MKRFSRDIPQKTWIPSYKEPRHSFPNDTSNKKIIGEDKIERRQVEREIGT